MHRECVLKIFVFRFFPVGAESEMLLHQNADGTIKSQYSIFFQQLATAILEP
jgi:hypothetical protein